MITPLQLYAQTMPYTLARLGLAGLFGLVAGLLLLLGLNLQDSLGLSLAQYIESLLQEDLGEDGPLLAVLCLWLAVIIALHFMVMHYVGYLLKAGHIAVLSAALATGLVPEKQMAFGKKAVLERFGTAHAYLLLDRLVAGAVSQLGKAVDKAGEALEDVPGVAAVSGVVRLFLRIALGHVDECCLALTFHRKSGHPGQDAADSVVLYFQNWKSLLKNASLLTLACCGLYALLGIMALVIFICLMDTDSGLAAFVGVFFFWIIKTSFIDNWVMIKMVAGFFGKAQDAQPKACLYDKLAGLSSKFNKLLNHPATDGDSPAPEAGAC